LAAHTERNMITIHYGKMIGYTFCKKNMIATHSGKKNDYNTFLKIHD
jgi:hypothetical protein